MILGVGFTLLTMMAIATLMMASIWTVFEKAGRPGWYALIPLWNLYQMVKLAGASGFSMILLFVPIVNLFYAVGLNIRVAKAFGQSTGFGIGMTLFGLIFWPLLAFGPAEYVRKPQASRERKSEPTDRPFQNENGDWIEEIPLTDW